MSVAGGPRAYAHGPVRLLLTTLGSHGDVHPFLALARALQARGHQTTLLTLPYFRELTLGAGVAFEPLGAEGDIADIARLPGAMSSVGGTIKLLNRVVKPATAKGLERFEQVLAQLKPDGVVAHPLCLGASIACERTATPLAMVALAPLQWWNEDDLPVFSPWDRARPSRWSVRAQLWLGKQTSGLLLDGELNRLRQARGLKPQRHHFYRLCRGGVINLGLWSPHFRPALASDPPHARVCGFAWFDRVRAAHEDPEARAREEFLRAGDMPIVFTLGTASVHVAGNFYTAAARACAALGKRALLLVGRPEYAPPGVASSDRVGIFTYAPFSEVFPRCAAIVHHGGIGTTAQALRSGRPQLVTPMSHDQFDNAVRVQRLEAGLRLRHGAITPLRLEHLLRRLLEEPRFALAAGTLGPQIAHEDGAAVAADALERALTGQDARAARPAAPAAHP